MSSRSSCRHFNPRAPYGARRLEVAAMQVHGRISIHAPLTGRDDGILHLPGVCPGISIHAPLTGRDLVDMWREMQEEIFQSTRPLRGATTEQLRRYLSLLFQSTRPLRGATRQGEHISTAHAISIHAPLTGRDAALWMTHSVQTAFQSTRPLRGATRKRQHPGHLRRHFNPRAPYGARRWETCGGEKCCLFQSTRPLRGATQRPGSRRCRGGISIHAPLTGRDLEAGIVTGDGNKFQSTRPLRGATCSVDYLLALTDISIHAPLTGRDCSPHRPLPPRRDFNPRAPYGARQVEDEPEANTPAISIHAPLTGRDAFRPASAPAPPDFNPRAPYGARRHGFCRQAKQLRISIHAPLTGRDALPPVENEEEEISIHAPLTGRDVDRHHGPVAGKAISIHAPLTGRDRPRDRRRQRVLYFNPRAPYGARPSGSSARRSQRSRFQSTRPLRGATPRCRPPSNR